MKFRSVPQDIEAVQFHPDKLDSLPAYVNVKQNQDEVWQVHNPLHDSWISVDECDWIRIDTPNDIYPIKDSYMKTKYRAVE